jgi:hypothetical protein
MTGNRIWIPTLGLAVLGVCAPSALAQDTRFKLYAGPAYVAPMSDSDVTFGTVTDAVEAQEEVGWNFGAEFRWGRMMGLELDYVNATQDVSYGGATIGEADFSPLTATLNFHLIHTKVVDFYIGPSYSYINWGEIHLNANGGSLTGSSEIGTDSAQGWGASLGLDFGLGEHFAITGGLKYLNVDLEVQDGPSIAVNPLVARLGVAVRF